MKQSFIAKALAFTAALACAFSVAACSPDDNAETTDDTYKIIGTVTHGNLYFLSKDGGETFDTAETLRSLIGKRVGVVQLPNVPGLILKSILKKNNVPYAQIESEANVVADKVNLLPISSDSAAQQITAANSSYDCFVAADPLVTLKTKQGLYRSGSLQSLYGEDGYPQAVIVGKDSFTEKYPAFTKKMMETLDGADEYLQNAESSAILAPFTAAYEATQMNGSWKTANLNADSVKNCNVKFEAAQICKNAVQTIVTEMFEVQGQTAPVLTDAFFYTPVTVAEDEEKPNGVTVYSPDGAPALILAQAMTTGKVDGVSVSYNIVSADTIGAYVSFKDDQSDKNADFCIMPVNLAAKLLGR